MRFARNTRSLTTWIAALGIFVATLAPTISHALWAGSPLDWGAICSVGGERLVSLDASGSRSAPAPDGGHAFDHCPYCSLHTLATGFVPAATPAPSLPVLAHERPRRRGAAAPEPAPWAVPPSRAPPTLA